MAGDAKLGRPIDSDGEATRTRVLGIARTAFAQLGYAATTYRLLADRAGLAPSALYNYFDSKAELYAEVHRQVQLATYEQWVIPAIADTHTFVDRLDALLGAFVEHNASSPEVAQFQAAANVDTVRHPELAAVRDKLPMQRRNLFGELVELGIRTGELEPRQRETVTAMLETLTLGLIEMSANPDGHRLAVQGFRQAIASMVSVPSTAKGSTADPKNAKPKNRKQK